MEWLVWFPLALLLLFVMTAIEEQQRKRKRRKEAYIFKPAPYANPNSPSSARFADEQALRKGGLFRGKGWRIGYSQAGRVMRYDGPGHLLLIAPARSGKAVSVLVPALLERRRASVILIDPKGELTSIVAARRKLFSDVVAIDPFNTLGTLGIRGVRRVGFNPLAALDPRSVSFGGDINTITDGLFVHDHGGGENSAYFNDAGQQLTSAVIRVLLKYEPATRHNLTAVREVLCGDVFGFAQRYADCDDPLVRQGLSRFTSASAPQSREFSGIISTAITQTAFVGVEGINESLSGTGLRFRDLKRKPMTVSLILPLDKIASSGKWFRICLAAALVDLLKAGLEGRGLPVLAVCDEFFSIGPMKSFQTAMSQAAGAAGLQLWPILQDLAQLQTMYGNEGWRTFISNTAVKMFFGSHGDKETSEYISALCGEREMVIPARSIRNDWRNNDVDVSDSGSVNWQRLIQPHEVRRLGPDQMITFVETVPNPIHAKRRPYYKDWEFQGQYGRNPYFDGRARSLSTLFGTR